MSTGSQVRLHPDGIMELSGEYQQPEQPLPPAGALLEFAAEEADERSAPAEVRRRRRRRSHRAIPRWGWLAIGLAIVLVTVAATLTWLMPGPGSAMVLASPQRVVPTPLDPPTIPRLDALARVVSVSGGAATVDEAMHTSVTLRPPAVSTSEVLDVVPASPAEMAVAP